MGRLAGWLFLLPWCSLAGDVIGTDLLTNTLLSLATASGRCPRRSSVRACSDNYPLAGRVIVVSVWLLVGAYLTADVLVVEALRGLVASHRAVGVWLGVAAMWLVRTVFRRRVREKRLNQPASHRLDECGYGPWPSTTAPTFPFIGP